MRKNSRNTIELYPTHRRAWVRLTVVLIVSLAITPLIIDGSKVCVARWRAMYGPVPTIQTPAIDFVTEVVSDYRREIGTTTTRFFNNVPWRAEVVIGGLGLCAVLAGYFLRNR